jgi:hypothetical protein
VQLDVGEDFNAYYNRQSLSFFYGDVDGATVYSGESPDIVCHEFGHAVLDSVRPQLWDAALDEVAAFHECFGDVSALLCALQLDDFRMSVLSETGGRIARSSSLSRLAEQLGWAIRQVNANAVDPDCLRNAANAFFYRNPSTLPPAGPASSLTSEPHSFSRVFSGAFLEALAGMLAIEGGANPTPANLLAVSGAAGRLVIAAAMQASIVPSYYAQIGNAMLVADKSIFGGKYTPALRQAFVRRGILSLKAAFASTKMQGIAAPAMAPKRAVARAPRRTMHLDSQELGLGDGHALVVQAPDLVRNPAALAAALDVGDAPERDDNAAVYAYMQDLVRRGRVDLSALGNEDLAGYLYTKRTHFLEKHAEGFVVRRTQFDCGFDPCCH